MAQLNQLLAVVKGRKSELNKTITDIYHKVQKKPLFDGIIKTYDRRDEDGETLPSEVNKVQEYADALLAEAVASFTALFATMGAVDKTNTLAYGDIVIGGDAIVEGVPATHLLWLEKALIDLRTTINNLPTLDPQQDWQVYEGGGYITPGKVTARTKKVPRNHVKAEATEKHPAQVEVFYEDTIVGDWTTRLRSGGMPLSKQRALLVKVDTAIEAVKTAREEANRQQVVDFTAKPLLDWILRQP